MRICIPTETDAGAGAPVSRHFGRAPWFSVVDTVTGEVEARTNRHVDHAHGAFDPVGELESVHPDAVVVAGIGGTALGRLAAAGIPTYLTSAATVGHVLSQVRAGGLKGLASASACAGGNGAGHHHHEA